MEWEQSGERVWKNLPERGAEGRGAGTEW